METNELVVKVPRGSMTDAQVENLKLIVEKKAVVLKKAFLTENITIIEEDGNLGFPWFTLTGDEKESMVFMRFVTKLLALAKKTRRVNSGPAKTVPNESYAFRCWLLRLDYIGDEYKEDRKILMRNFTKGSSAFRQKKEASDADTER
ncbi:MAG: hypothetical protein WCR02_09365 [Sphaerochaetaceae bacterium]